MKALQLLERCRALEHDLQAVESKIQRYRESATRVTSAIDGVGARGTAEPDKLVAIMAEIDELEREKAQREREYAVEVSAACKLLDKLPEIESAVLNGYYIQAKALKLVARNLNYSYGYVRAIKSNATARLDELPEAVVASLLPAWYA